MNLPALILAAALLQPLATPLFAAEHPAHTAAESDISRETMSMVSTPSLSPDGKTLAFSWDGDIWTIPSTGGEARRITLHDSEDTAPVFSRDGREIAFASRREGNVPQVFVIPVTGGNPRQITFNTEGAFPLSWFPDEKAILAYGQRDSAPDGYKAPVRFLKVNLEKRAPEEAVFDDYGASGSVSPDGRFLLFTREDHEPYRMGYRGSQAAQVWTYEFATKTFRRILKSETGYRAPVWRADGKGFYCLDGSLGAYNLASCELDTGKVTLLTHDKGSNAYAPVASADGSVVVFIRNGELFRFEPGKGGEPERIPVFNVADRERDTTVRRIVKTASDAVFSKDGLETFFTAGGDLWVMDSTVVEPHAITSTTAEEISPALSRDGKSVFFIRDNGEGCDIFRAERAEPSRYWWENDRFKEQPVTKDRVVKSDLKVSPDGKSLAYVRGLGDLVVCATDGTGARVLATGFSEPQFDWSPDGRWIVFAAENNEFNRDIFIVPSDGSKPAENVSRYPDNDSRPAFSPDGKCLAWLQRESEGKTNLAYVWLTRDLDERSARDRKIELAREKMSKERPTKGAAKKSSEKTEAAAPAAKTPGPKSETPATPAPVKKESRFADEAPGAKSEEKPAAKADEKAGEKPDDDAPAKPVEVSIDFADIHRRVHLVPVTPSAMADRVVWSADSKLAILPGALDGKDGLVGVDVTKDEPKAEFVGAAAFTRLQTLAKGKGYAGLAKGVPAVFANSAVAEMKFQARQEYDGVERRRAAFRLCWRLMRDNFYDAAMNNRDWNAVRAKYEESAAHAVDTATFDRVVNMMLGELNASHLGFRSTKIEKAPAGSEWKVETAALGLRFDPAFAGPGLRVSEVTAGGPTDRTQSRLAVGDILLSVDNKPVDPATDLTRVLNGPLDRDLDLLVKNAAGKERNVVLRPVSYIEIRKKLRENFLRSEAAKVAELSGGKFGYLHIDRMDWASFKEFERGLYEQGYGKDGLIVDVRDNGGGFTTDHLLTVLTQPLHAITVPRGGSVGYPRDRSVYTPWSKPVVVLCNQNSFSNAEVFSHAVKNIGRGKLVGVRTAGGVISTGAAPVFDLGEIRMPFRGWYNPITGEDYELNGAKPDFEVWNEPGEIAAGKDRQLEKAVEVLRREVAETPPLPKPVNAHADGR